MSSAEKPFHYNYLKEFRTQQCPLFLQHKCTQHRPFTCFHYHFANQRRRRPKKKKDNVFNYSPDIYCSVYDEATGVCKNGDDCPYLHRVAGDVERRYHLRYYKTAMCVYETDARGYCVKNGAHCAYSHGPDDLRQPVFDSHTDPSAAAATQLSESTESIKVGSMDSGSGLGSPRPRSYSGSSVRSDKSSAFDDQRWQDATYVLVFYKTDLCPKPARACRQGYACPYFHNARDRRRSPKTYKYRSTPCPSVKHGDEWGDPTQCESGDACQYCHSRTEQQFHPEIYKSTRCNDMLQTNQCPRGPFCAFAHYDQICSARDLLNDTSYIQAFSQSPSSGASLPSSMPTAPPPRPSSLASPGFGSPVTSVVPGEQRVEDSPQQQAVLRKQLLSIEQDSTLDASEKAKRKQFLLQHRALNAAAASPDMMNSSSFASVAGGSQSHGLSSGDSNITVSTSGGNSTAAMNSHLENLVGASLEDLNMDSFEVTDLEREINNRAAGRSSQRESSFMGLGYSSGLDIFSQPGAGGGPSSRAASSTSGSVSGRHGGDIFEGGDQPPQRPASNSVGTCSANNGLSSSLTPMRSPYLTTVQQQQHLPSLGGRNGDQAAASRMQASSIFSGYGGPNIGLGSFFGAESDGPEVREMAASAGAVSGIGGGGGGGSRPRESPRLPPTHSGMPGGGSQSGSRSGGSASSFGAPQGGSQSDVGFAKAIGSHRSGGSTTIDPLPLPSSAMPVSGPANSGSLADQLSHAKRRLSMWEASWQQAKNACEAWRKEVENSAKKLHDLEEENETLKIEISAAESRAKDLEMCSTSSQRHSLDRSSSVSAPCSGVHSLEPGSRLAELPLESLRQALQQLQDDQARLIQIITDRQGSLCLLCKEECRSTVCEPCMHCVLCERCATSNSVCPYCGNAIDSTISVFLPPPC